jgi:4-hydroxy-tetrahydrodipicolinate synthase
MLSLGAHGLVSVAAHVVGDRLKALIEAFPNDPKNSACLHHQLTPVFKAIFSAPSPVPVKYATSKRGFDCARVRLPLVELSEDEKRVVDAVL